MRHKVDGRKFDRNSGSRKAMFRNLLTQFFKHDRIVTTEAKAKEVRRIAEKLITKAKREDLHARRQVLKVVPDKDAVKRLFDIILAKVSDRNQGGYTRIIKIGNRKGDDAPLALLEILEPGSGQTKPKKGRKKKAAKGKAKAKKEKAQAKTISPKKEKLAKTKEPETEESLAQTTTPEEDTATDNILEEAEKQEVQESAGEGQTEEPPPSDEEIDEDKDTDAEETKDTSEDEKDVS